MAEQLRDEHGRFIRGDAVTITLSGESAVLLQRLAAALDRTAFYKVVFRMFDKLASRAAAYVVKNKLSGQLLKRRTGQLAQGVVGVALYRNGVPAMRVGIFRGPARLYAAAQELGADIRPVKAKALAIPLAPALTPAGVARWPGPRSYPGVLRFIPFRKSGIAVGALYDAAQLKALPKGATFSSLKAVYLLLRQVRIPAKHFLFNGMREFIPSVANEMAVFIQDSMRGLQSR